MTRDEIDKRLQLEVLSVCLAATAGDVGDIKTAKHLLICKVEKLIAEARGKSDVEQKADERAQLEKALQSWYCEPCAVEVYDVRCSHCGKTKREQR